MIILSAGCNRCKAVYRVAVEFSVGTERHLLLAVARIVCYGDRTSEVLSWIMRDYLKI